MQYLIGGDSTQTSQKPRHLANLTDTWHTVPMKTKTGCGCKERRERMLAAAAKLAEVAKQTARDIARVALNRKGKQ